MPRPIRINKIKVRVRELSTVTTVKDVDFREAKQNRVYGPPIDLVGQIVGLKPFFTLQRTVTGDATPSTSHLLFRVSDLEAIGYAPKKGDKLIEVDGVTVDFDCIQSTRATPFGGGFGPTSFAKPILWHVSYEQNRKALGSL